MGQWRVQFVQLPGTSPCEVYWILGAKYHRLGECDKRDSWGERCTSTGPGAFVLYNVLEDKTYYGIMLCKDRSLNNSLDHVGLQVNARTSCKFSNEGIAS